MVEVRLLFQLENANLNFCIPKNTMIASDTTNRKNFGYAALSKIYHELGIHTFLTNRQRHTKEAYDADTIMKMLVFSRLLAPASKKKSYEDRMRFFEKDNYSLDDVYRSLTFFNKRKAALQLWINDKIKSLYGRDTTLVYYDVTNYYFETDKTDNLKKKGISKEHRPNLSRIKHDYGLGKAVVVADKGMTTGDNIWYTLSAGDGYVFSMSVRSADKELKDYVLDKKGYEWLGSEYKRKSRLCPRTILVTAVNGRKMRKTVDEKQVVFYSEKYDKRAKAECTHIQQNYYLFDYYDEILETIGNKLELDFSKQILSLGEIKKILRNTKK
ncbi:MAG: hypothetical protein PHC44_12050 [Lutispora sp.]|nr:hypothetical protein [Lutispora sp.]